MRTIMRAIASAIIITSGVVGLIGSALAADMTAAEIKAFLSGKTVYLEATTASASGQAGQGVIYWAEDGTALYKTPTGAMFHGKWEIKGNTNCAEWKERPSMGCVRYDKSGDVVMVIDIASGQGPRQSCEDRPGQCREAGALTGPAPRYKQATKNAIAVSAAPARTALSVAALLVD